MSINNLIGYYSNNLQYNICNNNLLLIKGGILNPIRLNNECIVNLNISENRVISKLTNLKILNYVDCPNLSQKLSESVFSNDNISLNSLTQLEYLEAQKAFSLEVLRTVFTKTRIIFHLIGK